MYCWRESHYLQRFKTLYIITRARFELDNADRELSSTVIVLWRGDIGGVGAETPYEMKKNTPVNIKLVRANTRGTLFVSYVRQRS